MGASTTGDMTARALLDSLRARPEAVIVDDVGPMAGAELAQRIEALVTHLRAVGVDTGRAVLIVSPNRREVVEAEVACLVGGWTAVPVNWHFDAEGVARVLADLGAAAIVVDPVLLGLVRAALERREGAPAAPLPVLVLDGGDRGDDHPDHEVDYERALERAGGASPRDERPGSMIFSTSGTTGRSRSVRFLGPPGHDHDPVSPILRHHLPTLDAAAVPVAGRTLLCGPHYHWAQWTFGLLPLLRGSTVVLHQRFVPANLLAAIDRHGITNLLLLPSQIIRLLRLDERVRAGFGGRELQRVVHGAARCPVDGKRAMIDWWGPVMTEYYGAAEGGVVTLATSEEWHDHPGSVGRAVPGKQITVVGDDGTVAPVGRDGVVHVRSEEGLSIEYVGAPAATTATRALPGHVTFGDIGHLDDDGYLTLSDRRSDMIVTGGVNVPSGQVEAVIAEHPAVADVAVYGVPDSTAGQVVRAAVEVTADAPDDLVDQLLELCRSRLPEHQRPVAVEVLDQLPRSATGKLVKRRLRAPYWEPHIGPIRLR
ncbi:MAG: AMP-binding protein [Ilumatobacteraceae bacterium]